MVGRLILAIAFVIALALQRTQGQVPTSIVIRVLQSAIVNPAASEALDANSTLDVGIPIEVDITPNDALLQSSIVVSVTIDAASSTATEGMPGPPQFGDFSLTRTEVTFDLGANDGNRISVPIDVFDDPIIEGTESFTVSITMVDPPTGVTVDPNANTGTVNILDDDVAFLRFSSPAYSQNEPVSPLSVNLVLDATTSGTIAQNIVASITASAQLGDTASAGADFIGTTCTVLFAAGSGPGTVSTPSCDITIINDNNVEQNEVFSLSASILNSNGQDAQFTTGGDSASATIVDDDLQIGWQLTTYPAAEGTPSVVACAQVLNGAANIGTRTITVQVSANPIDAQGGGVDYGTPNPTTFTFTSGQTTQCTSIPINDDSLVEGDADETFTIQLSSPSDSGVSLSPAFATVSIDDNDDAVFQFFPSDYTVNEDVASGQQAVTLELVSGTLTFDIGIQVSVTGGSATGNGGDFSGPAPAVVTFLENDGPTTTRNTIFTIIDDSISGEPDETIEISGSSLSTAGRFAQNGDTATITIIDDVVRVNVQLDATAYNAAEGTPTVAVCVDALNLQDIAGRTIPVTISATPGSAQGGGTDYGPLPATCNPLSFSASSGSRLCCNIPINDDNLVENVESFNVALTTTDLNNANLVAPTTAIVNIADNDVAILEFTQQLYSVQENLGPLAVNLRLASNSPTLASNLGPNPVQVLISTDGTGSATAPPNAGADYSAVSTLVSFNAGDDPLTLSQPQVSITIMNDNTVEQTETFGLTGTITNGAVLAQLVDNTATAQIIDDDGVVFRFEQPDYTIREDGVSQTVCVLLVTGSIQAPIQISVTVASGITGTATANDDFTPIVNTLMFPAGSSIGPPPARQCTSVDITNDDLLEDEFETIPLTAFSGSPDASFSPGGNSATISIQDDETVTIELVGQDPNTGLIEPPDVSEPENGNDPLLCLRLSAGVTLARNVVVNLATVLGGTAQVVDDYTPINSQVIFTPTNQGQTLCRIIPVADDLICEADETIFVSVTTTDPAVNLSPSSAVVTIIDNDVASISTDADSYCVTEFEDEQLTFNVELTGQKGAGRSCVVAVSTLEDSATAPDDFTAINPAMILVFNNAVTSLPVSIDITDDLVFEPTEHFNISLSTTSDGCTIPNPIIPVYIKDDEDCTEPDGPCDENAICEEFPGRNNFSCTCMPMFMGDGFMCQPRRMIGDDPHFSIVLPDGTPLCYTVQGEQGFVFSLISNKMFHMNAMFVPDSRREEVTWLGSIGIVVHNNGYKASNATYLRFETKGKKIYIGDKVALEAKNIEKLSFNNGKLTISEAPPSEGFKYPSVEIDLRDVGLHFAIKFMNEHLDLFWHCTGHETKNSHGLIGQFFRKGVEVDTVRKILILPGKEPVPVMRRPVWSFMEREVADDQLCWTAMNPGYQGEGLIDGTYFDYLVNDVLSTDFRFKKRQ